MLKEETFLSRIADMGTGESEYKLAIKLPRMSFEITSMSYDPTRQLPKINTMSKAIQNSVISRQRLYSATPYTIGFQLNVYAKNQDDALQSCRADTTIFRSTIYCDCKTLCRHTYIT